MKQIPWKGVPWGDTYKYALFCSCFLSIIIVQANYTSFYTTLSLTSDTSIPYSTLLYTMCGPTRPSSGGRIAVLFPASSSAANSYSVLFHNSKENTQATFRADNNDIESLAALRGCSAIDLRIEYVSPYHLITRPGLLTMG